jgi:hypothetical protein
MSAARDLFLQIGSFPRHGDREAYEKLCEAAELWRGDGQYFSAGIAMSRACDAARGRPDDMLKAEQAAIKDFEQAITLLQGSVFGGRGVTGIGGRLGS